MKYKKCKEFKSFRRWWMQHCASKSFLLSLRYKEVQSGWILFLQMYGHQYLGLHLWKWRILTFWFLLILLSSNVWVHVKGRFLFKILLNENFVIECTSNLESMMHVAIEGPNNDFDDILISVLDLWKDAAKFSICIAIQSAICLVHLMMHLRKYPKP